MLNFDPNQVVIYTLVFLLGLLVGGFLFTGGGRKWKARYNAEADRRKEIEARHVAAEKDWREQDSLRNAAAKDRNRDGVVDEREGTVDRRSAVTDRRARDRDGVTDDRDPDDRPL